MKKRLVIVVLAICAALVLAFAVRMLLNGKLSDGPSKDKASSSTNRDETGDTNGGQGDSDIHITGEGVVDNVFDDGEQTPDSDPYIQTQTGGNTQTSGDPHTQTGTGTQTDIQTSGGGSGDTQATPDTSLTLEEYMAMSSAEQQAFCLRFGDDIQAYVDWYHAAVADYEARNPSVDIGGDSIDMEELPGRTAGTH